MGRTIFALSSGAPPAAIAIIRISGPDAGPALEDLAGRLPLPRHATNVRLRNAAGETLDHALALWFPGPRSATGEDLAELHVHGSRAVIAAVLGALGRFPGLVPAPPGAFTRRALANGRIDLAEAEGLADLLSAEAESQRRHALRLVEGGLGRMIDGWRATLLGIASSVEALIDHEEELDEVPSDAEVRRQIADLHMSISEALAQPPAERLRDGVRVLLAGPVNAGKSSLLNALVGREAAIASPMEGTTRDLIEVPIVLDGLPLVFIDSAGLRDTSDQVERIGVTRAYEAQGEADIVLWLGDAADAPSRAGIILVAAKSDLHAVRPDDGTRVSATTGEGLDELRRRIVQGARAALPPEERVALHQRHRILLGRAAEELLGCSGCQELLLVTEHLRSAAAHLDAISGRAGVEDMLDALFQRFCIGK